MTDHVDRNNIAEDGRPVARLDTLGAMAVAHLAQQTGLGPNSEIDRGSVGAAKKVDPMIPVQIHSLNQPLVQPHSTMPVVSAAQQTAAFMQSPMFSIAFPQMMQYPFFGSPSSLTRGNSFAQQPSFGGRRVKRDVGLERSARFRGRSSRSDSTMILRDLISIRQRGEKQKERVSSSQKSRVRDDVSGVLNSGMGIQPGGNGDLNSLPLQSPQARYRKIVPRPSSVLQSQVAPTQLAVQVPQADGNAKAASLSVAPKVRVVNIYPQGGLPSGMNPLQYRPIPPEFVRTKSRRGGNQRKRRELALSTVLESEGAKNGHEGLMLGRVVARRRDRGSGGEERKRKEDDRRQRPRKRARTAEPLPSIAPMYHPFGYPGMGKGSRFAPVGAFPLTDSQRLQLAAHQEVLMQHQKQAVMMNFMQRSGVKEFEEDSNIRMISCEDEEKKEFDKEKRRLESIPEVQLDHDGLEPSVPGDGRIVRNLIDALPDELSRETILDSDLSANASKRKRMRVARH